MGVQEDMARVSDWMQRFAKAYGDAVREAFEPFRESVERMREQRKQGL